MAHGKTEPRPDRQALPGPSSPQGTVRHPQHSPGEKVPPAFTSPVRGSWGQAESREPLQRVCRAGLHAEAESPALSLSPAAPLQGHAGRQPPPLLWASARLPPTETRAPSVAGGHRHLRCFREGTWCVSPPPPPGPRRAGDRSLPQLPPPANASQARPVLRLTRRSQRVLEALPAPPGRGGRPGVGSPRRPRGRDNGRADPAWVSDRGELLPRDHGRLAACAVVSVA